MRKILTGFLLAAMCYLMSYGPIFADNSMQKLNQYIKIWKAEATGWMLPGKMDKQAIYNRFGQPDATRSNISFGADYMDYNPPSELLVINGFAMSFAFKMHSDILRLAEIVFAKNVRIGKRYLSARDVAPAVFLNGSVIPGWQVMNVTQKCELMYTQKQGPQWFGSEEYWPYRTTVYYRALSPKEMVGDYGRYNQVEVGTGFYLPASRKKKVFNPKTLTYSDQVDYSGWKDQAPLRYISISMHDRL